MTKEIFETLYKEQLNLSDKSWDFIEKGNRKKNRVSISQLREVDKDFLYYNYLGIIWEIDLKQYLLEQNCTLRVLLKRIFEAKESIGDVEFIERKGRLTHQVELPLKRYGFQITETSTKNESPKVQYTFTEQKDEVLKEQTDLEIFTEIMNEKHLADAFSNLLSYKKTGSITFVNNTIKILENICKQ